MQTSVINIALFSSLQVLLSLTCFRDVIGAASHRGEFIFGVNLWSEASESRCFLCAAAGSVIVFVSWILKSASWTRPGWSGISYQRLVLPVTSLYRRTVSFKLGIFRQIMDSEKVMSANSVLTQKTTFNKKIISKTLRTLRVSAGPTLLAYNSYFYVTDII